MPFEVFEHPRGSVDPRDNLSRARRKDLEYTMRKHDLPWQPGMSANVMREILKSNGIMQAESYVPEVEDASGPQITSTEQVPPGTIEAPKPDLESMKTFELYKQCTDRGIKFPKTSKRLDLLKLIWQHDAIHGENTS